MEDFKSIKVKVREQRKLGETKLKVKNPTTYKLIGQGAQGAVFKLSSKRCVKIYAKKTSAKKELKAIEAGQRMSFMPKLYESAPTYIVMEYIKGKDLKRHLRKHGEVSELIVKQVLDILSNMKKLKFTRLDMRLRHILVTKDEELKVVDHVNAYTTKSSKPRLFLKDLKREKLLKPFLKEVKKIDRALYKEWRR
ncbi:AarF/UbiB family protein [Ammoniphilus sp. CFH 90114]|uniref:AarF/UbiB family protein n=1 Tax=Ammoniphilus sp. CFH 90114 TaxID=2493665 RepID=UPI00100E2D39|nr:AarF/UbiB family protein [Ammoniphilus sp. CFH 90114]RXT13959.1 kinase [Ammoniphilus sp. CFH 90114]